MSNREQIKKRVIQAAESALYHRQYVSALDVFMGMGWLQGVHIQDWKNGRKPNIEGMIQGNLAKISFAMKCFRSWALGKGLKPSKTVYLAKTRGPKRALQFSKSGDPAIEGAYMTHYISPLLTEKKREKVKEKLEKQPELVAFVIKKPSQCSRCHKELGKGCVIYKEGADGLCFKCAGFEDLVFLASGNTKLTRRTKKYSPTHLVVVEWSRARKRYERQGLMVQVDALKKAQDELKDELADHERFLLLVEE